MLSGNRGILERNFDEKVGKDVKDGEWRQGKSGEDGLKFVKNRQTGLWYDFPAAGNTVTDLLF